MFKVQEVLEVGQVEKNEPDQRRDGAAGIRLGELKSDLRAKLQKSEV